MLAAAMIDLQVLRRSTLWPDEIFSLAMATGHSLEHPAALADAVKGDFVEPPLPVSFAEIRRYIDHENPPASAARVLRAVYLSDTSPPLYYLLLSAWTRIAGTTDGDLRAFSVGWFLLSIPFVLGLARRVGGGRAQLGAGVLFITSPLAIYYSTEGRMYSLLWFCVVATGLLTLRSRDHPRDFKTAAGWVLASAGGLLVHYFFFFPWCAMIAFRAVPFRAANLRRLAVQLAPVALLIMPWYWHLPATLRHWRVTGDWLTWLPEGFERARVTLAMTLQFFSNDGFYLWWDHPTAKIFLLSTFAALLLFMVQRRRANAWRGRVALLWLWFAAAVAGPSVFDLLRHTYTVDVPRYAIAAFPAAALLGGVALGCLPRLFRYGALGIIVGAWYFSVKSIYENPSRNDQPYWKLGQLLHDTRPSDLVIAHSTPSGAAALARYATGEARFVPWVGQLGQRTVPGSIEALCAAFERVIFVCVHEVGEPAPEEDWLRSHWRLEHHARYGNARISQFVRGESAGR